MTYYIDKIKVNQSPDGEDTLEGYVPSIGLTYYSRLGHTVGQCYKCPDQPVVYINTPKCASSFMKTQVLDLGWQPRFLQLGDWVAMEPTDMIKPDDIEKIIVVMRDPYDRWLSGIAEYFGEHFNDPDGIFDYLSNPLTLNLLSQRIWFDDHTESQLFFLQHVPLEKCVFFRQEQGLNYKISDYFKTILNIPNNIVSEKPVHVSTGGSWNGRVKQHLDRLLRENNVEYMNVLKAMEQDYEFMDNMVHFYGD